MNNEDLTYIEVNFDLSVAKLQQHYPKKNWPNAWRDIKRFLEKNGFEHVLYSGYASKKPMNRAEAEEIFNKMNKELPWIAQCARAVRMAEAEIDKVDLMKSVFRSDINFTMDEKEVSISEKTAPERKPLSELMADGKAKAVSLNEKNEIAKLLKKEDLSL